jgi:hypothetical protein
LASFNCTVNALVELPSASSVVGLAETVLVAVEAAPGTEVIEDVVPVTEPVVAVTVPLATVVGVVKTTVAVPLASVVEVALANEPPVNVVDQVTTSPDVDTALSLASANCAEIVVVPPAVGLEVEAVTRYFAAVPATEVIEALVPVIVFGAVPLVAVTVPLATVVGVVKTTVATPLASVVDVALANEPPVNVVDQVTTSPAVDTALSLASANCAEIVVVPPAVGLEVEAVTRYFAAAPAVTVTFVESADVRPLAVKRST